TYFIPYMEIQYGAAFAIVFYSSLRQGKYVKELHYALLIVWAVLVLNSHLINQLLFLFLALWDVVDRGYQKKLHHLLFFMLAVFMLIALLNIHPIEKNVLVDSSVNLAEYIFHIHPMVIARAFIKNFPELFLALFCTSL